MKLIFLAILAWTAVAAAWVAARPCYDTAPDHFEKPIGATIWLS